MELIEKEMNEWMNAKQSIVNHWINWINSLVDEI